MAGSNNNVRTINFQYDKRGDYIETAKAFKEAGIKLPIILDGGFSTPDLAEKALQEGACDFIGIGRPILADPCYAKKGQREPSGGYYTVYPVLYGLCWNHCKV